MKNSKVYVFIFDGYSDWEPSYAMAEISKSDKYQLLTVALDKKAYQVGRWTDRDPGFGFE
jgi:hypothetical protein